MQAQAAQAIDDAFVDDLSRRLADGASATVSLSGWRRRAELALRLAQLAPSPVLLISATLDDVQATLRAEPALGRRTLIISGLLDNAELALRVREIATATPRLIAVEPDRLWQARMLRALRACRPRLVMLDTGALAIGALERSMRAETLLRWVREVLPDTPALILCRPGLPSFLDRLASVIDATPWQIGPLLPDGIALRVSALQDESERRAALLDAVRDAAGAAFVIAPSRGKARTVAAGLAQAGYDAAIFHSGLSATDRAAILTAVRDGRQQLVVATEALTVVSDLPCPSLLAFSHLPWSLESVLSLAERAEAPGRSTTPDAGIVVQKSATQYPLSGTHEPRLVPLLICSGPQDAPAGVETATSSVPGLPRLRRIYGALRGQAGRGYLLLDPERLSPVLPEGTFSRQRLALEVLEHAGFLQRRADFARAATITLTVDDSALVSPLDTVVSLRRGVPAPVEPMQVAAALGWPPHRLHQWLLDAEDRGLLGVRSIGRELLFALREPSATAARMLTAAVERLRRWAIEDAAGTEALVQASACRMQALARTLDWPLPEPCGRCDRCAAPARRQATKATTIVLQALAAVPRGLPRGAALRAARHALAAYGRATDADRSDEIVDTLLARDLLATRPGELGPVVVVSESGHRLLAALTTRR